MSWTQYRGRIADTGMLALATVLLCLVLGPPVVAQSSPGALMNWELIGTIGPYRVGANMTIREGSQFVAGHYFYVSHLTNIPLTGRVEGENVTLEAPGGESFHLHFLSNGSAKGQPLTFENSVALEGQWQKGDKVLPVTLHMDSAYPGERRGRWYQDVTSETDEAFEARVQRFLQAVLHGDRSAAADAVSYPLKVFFPSGSSDSKARRPLTVGNKSAFVEHWNDIFTPTYVAKLREAVPHEMFVHEGMAMVADGAAWFDAKGAVSLNVN